MKRKFFDAPTELRCLWDCTLKDGSTAQCGRKKVDGEDLCSQHLKMYNKWSCEYCGGNDSYPPEHCMDCENPEK